MQRVDHAESLAAHALIVGKEASEFPRLLKLLLQISQLHRMQI